MPISLFFVFFFNDTSTTEIYTLSLHDALPIFAIGHIRRNFPFFANFDGYVYSYQQGAMKPDPKVYEAVERMTGAQSKEILFLDDRKENVATAFDRGWQVIHHQSWEETLAALRRLNLLGEDR